MEKQIKDYLYFAEFGENKKRNTIVSLKKDLKQFRKYLKNVEKIESVGEISSITIRGYLLALQEKKVSNRSMNRKLSSLRMFFRYLVNNKIIYQNPAETVPFPEFEAEKPDILTLEEINKIRDVISLTKFNGMRDRLMVELMYSSGITMSELLSLGESVFDLDKRELYVGTEKHKRVVFFSVRTRKYFKKYIEMKKKKFKDRYDEDILFVNGSGKRLTDRSLRRIIEKYRKKAEIEKKISPYTFRHTFACYLLKNGMDIYYLQELLGHLEIGSTKYYLELI